MQEQTEGFGVSFTGHRGSKLPQDPYILHELERRLVQEIQCAIDDGATVFYSGMASGVDLMAARAVLDARKQHPRIRLIGVVPYVGQKKSLHGAEYNLYCYIEQEADEMQFLAAHYTKSCFTIRNRFLVSHCQRLIAMVSNLHSGTGQTIRMAKKSGTEIRIIDIPTVMQEIEEQSMGDSISPQ